MHTCMGCVLFCTRGVNEWGLLQDLAKGAAFAKLPVWLARMEAIAGTAATNAFYTSGIQ